jgi:hypothetical protein
VIQEEFPINCWWWFIVVCGDVFRTALKGLHGT